MTDYSLAYFAGPVFVTCGYLFFWYYLLLVRQRGTKYRLRREYAERGEVFDRYFGQDEEMLAADRVVINTHEQMVPFLVSLWMFSFYVSAGWATILGAAYTLLRIMYPFLLGRRVSKVNSKKVAFATMPCYAIILTFLVGSLVKAAGLL